MSTPNRHWSGLGPLEPPKSVARELDKVLVATPIEGWRCWNIHRPESLTLTRAYLQQAAEAFDTGGNPFRALSEQLAPRLKAIGVDSVWDEPIMDAKCAPNAGASIYAAMFGPIPGPTDPHEAPHVGCHCGFWVLRTQGEAEKMAAKVEAFGRVAIWGRVIEFAQGYRAEHAKPLEIVLLSEDEDTAQSLREFYGCEVRFAPEVKAAAVKQQAEEQRKAAKLKMSSYSALIEQSMSRAYAQYAQSLGAYPPSSPPRRNRKRRGR